jgi:hypothetical protein
MDKNTRLKLTEIIDALKTAVDTDDLGAIVNGVTALEEFAGEGQHQQRDPYLDENNVAAAHNAAEALETLPTSDALTEAMTLENPYGRQEIYVSENRQYKVSLAKGYDFNCQHPIGWLVFTPLTDDAPLHDWRIMQQFKNELCGAQNYAVEIYPAESDLVDCNNNMHLFVWLDGYKPPFGMRGRKVVDPSLNPPYLETATPQRPFARRPPGAVNALEATEAILRGNVPFTPTAVAQKKIAARKAKNLG